MDFSITQLSRRLSCDRGTLAKRLADTKPVRQAGPMKRYALLQGIAAPGDGPQQNLTAEQQAATLLLTKRRIELMDVELGKLRGDLVSASDFVKAEIPRLAAFRDRLRFGVTGLAVEIHGLTTKGATAPMIGREILSYLDAALQDLSEMTIEALPDDDAPPAAAPA